MDGDEQEGLLEVARHDGRTEVAAGQHAGAGIHDESALGDALLLGMAFVATLGEDRADVLLEEFEAGGIHLRLSRSIRGAEQDRGAPGEQERQESERGRRALHGSGEVGKEGISRGTTEGFF